MKKVVLYIFMVAFLFGTMEVALKIVGNALDPLQTTFLRFMLGGVVILPVAVWEMKKNKVRLTFGNWMYMLLLGIVCIPVSMLLFQIGVIYSNAATASVLISTSPVFTVVFAHFMTKNDRFSKGKVAAILFGIMGFVMMLRPWDIQEGNTVKGTILLMTASVAFGLYSVLGAKTVNRIGTFTQLSFSFILGSLVLLVVLFITGRPVIEGVADELPMVIYVSIVVTGLGYIFYFLAIKESTATTGSIAFFIKPIIAPIIAVVVLSEVITWNMYLGILLILIASFIIIWERKKYDNKSTDFDVFSE